MREFGASSLGTPPTVGRAAQSGRVVAPRLLPVNLVQGVQFVHDSLAPGGSVRHLLH
jgi:hypothetical protein